MREAMWQGRGLEKGSRIERLYREVCALIIYEGASEIQRQTIARQLLREQTPWETPGRQLDVLKEQLQEEVNDTYPTSPVAGAPQTGLLDAADGAQDGRDAQPHHTRSS